MTERVLFIGNGFNLVSDQGASWNALLNKMAGRALTNHEAKIRSAKPFTLWYEEICSRSPSEKFKDLIVTSLRKELSHNKHHVDAMSLDFKHILTTNYDYNLEKAAGEKWKSNNSAPENYYSLFRKSSLHGRQIWHIHGELDNARSIMLGHRQYSGYMHKIRSYLGSGVETTVKQREGQSYLSKFSGKKEKTKGDTETWVDLFLEHEVHVIGFSFDYTENHLWNLLTEKQRLVRKGVSIGSVIFHRCSNKKQTTEDEARLSIMSALGVKVVDHTLNTYEMSYTNCIQSLR